MSNDHPIPVFEFVETLFEIAVAAEVREPLAVGLFGFDLLRYV
jgi:hypothetical protein